MRGKKLLATAALSVLLFSGCGIANRQTAITVNGISIPKSAIEERINDQIKALPFTTMGVKIKESENDFLYIIAKERAVKDAIIEALINEECKNRGIEVSKDERALAMEDYISKVGSKERFKEQLQKNGITEQQFNKLFDREVKMRKLAQQLTDAKVTEADARKYYKANIKTFQYPEKVRASHILISTNPEEIEKLIRADKANKKLTDDEIKGKIEAEIVSRKIKAEELLKEVQQDKEKFAKIAREKSDDKVSGSQGGELGYFAAVEMVPEFSNASFATKPGNIHPKVVQTQFGYHIIYVMDRKAAGTSPFETVQHEIMSYLEAQNEIKAIDGLLNSLLKNAEIKYVDSTYNPEVLKETLQQELQKSNIPQVGEKVKDKISSGKIN